MTKIQSYKTKKGTRYKFALYCGIDELTGKKHYVRKQGYKDRRSAKTDLTRYEYMLQTGELLHFKGNMTFEELSMEWLEVYKMTVKPKTYDTKRFMLKAVNRVIGSYRIGKIKLADCQRFINDWAQIRANVRPYYFMIKHIFDFAIDNEYIRRNPMNKVRLPKNDSKPRETRENFYTKPELLEFLDTVKKYYPFKWYATFYTLAFTGLRKGELAALTWSDIDLENATLSVNKDVVYIGSKLIEQSPKTASGVRKIGLDSSTVAVLKEWHYQQASQSMRLGQGTPKRVFPTTNPNTYNNFLNKFYSNHTNFKKISVHGFRHTHCTMLFEAGANPQSVKKRLGHNDIQTTLNIYAHVSNQVEKKVLHDFADYMQAK